MDDLISRSALIKDLKKEEDECENCMIMPSWHSALKILDEQPTVDAVPVVHGKWLYNGFVKEWECSECHSSISLSDDRNSHPNFCPNCGADMRKKVQE